MGRKAEPVAVSQESDEAKSCPQLAAELNAIDTNLWRLNKAEDEKSKQNAFFGATAAVLIAPAVMLDVSDANTQEIAAWKERKRHLLWIADQKQCGFKAAPPEGAAH
jgi:seryl-tRNA synthetase